MRVRVTVSVVTWVVLMGCLGFAAPASLPKALAPLEFLLGEWDGGGTGTPGQATGGTTFAPGLQDRVIVRTNVAVVGATDKAPASRHDDLMIIYADDTGSARADYYDNEGHVIRYVVTVPGPGRAVFTSESSPNSPRCRLTYDAAPDGAVKGAFLLASPGKPDAFSPYLNWEMHRIARR
jgi:hypothetical protein